MGTFQQSQTLAGGKRNILGGEAERGQPVIDPATDPHCNAHVVRTVQLLR